MNKRNSFLYAALTALSVSATAQTMSITRAGDTTIVKIAKSPKYLLLPIEEGKDEAQVMLDNGKKTDGCKIGTREDRLLCAFQTQ